MARLVGGDKHCDQEDDPGEQEVRRPPQLTSLPLIGRIRPDYGDVVRGREHSLCLVFRQLRENNWCRFSFQKRTCLACCRRNLLPFKESPPARPRSPSP